VRCSSALEKREAQLGTVRCSRNKSKGGNEMPLSVQELQSANAVFAEINGAYGKKKMDRR
jgi:hypothetical protein